MHLSINHFVQNLGDKKEFFFVLVTPIILYCFMIKVYMNYTWVSK